MSIAEPYRTQRAEVTPDNCDREPVHIPGRIQPHGVLLVVRTADLEILQTSDNSMEWLGETPETLPGRNLRELVGVANADGLRALLARNDLENLPRHVFSFSPVRASMQPGTLDVTAHLSNGVLVLEMERASLMQADQLRDAYGLLNGSITRLQTAATLRDFCQSVTEEVARLTGLDRIMVYRFAEDDSGWVCAETRREGVESYLDFHYPAEDIPRPAREIFAKIWLRSVPDIWNEPAELVPLANPDSGRALDMTFCFLRGVSPMYAEYLKNMRVRMSLTMSIRREGRLWGLIACHHYAPKVIDHPVRAACELLAQVASLQVKAMEDREHAAQRTRQEAGHEMLRARTFSGKEAELSRLVTDRPNLLDFIEAGGAVLHGGGRNWTLGKVPTDVELVPLVAWLRQRDARPGTGAGGGVFHANILDTHALGKLYPPAEAFQDVASGLLAVPVSRSGQEWLLWFRPETVRTVDWAGNPNIKSIVQKPDGPRLMPRNSFERWKETVCAQSLPWQPFEIDAARKLRQIMLEMVIGRAEQALRDADRHKDIFIATLAHELRNPLAPISNAVAILREVEASDPKINWCGDVIDRQVVQMSHLLEDLLDVSRIAGRKVVLKRKPLALATVIDHAIEVARPLIAKAGHTLTVSLPDERLLLDGDAVRMTQIFANLLTNAAKYTPVGGHIELKARLDGGEIMVAVKDDGIGLSAEHLARVFDLFSQVDETLERSQGGLGIGLSLVKGLVEMHLGTVSGHSEGPGKGSEFVVRLPRSAETSVQMPAAPAARERPAGVRHRVLVVDDNDDGADSLAMVLRLLGNEAEIASDGPQALLKAQVFRPGVILLDIGLPGMNGFDTCREIRAQEWGKDIVVLAITGWGQDEDRRKSSEAGFDGHLVKPLVHAELMKLIAAAHAAKRGDGV